MSQHIDSFEAGTPNVGVGLSTTEALSVMLADVRKLALGVNALNAHNDKQRTLINATKAVANDAAAVANAAKIAAANSVCVIPFGAVSATTAFAAFIAPAACTIKSVKLVNKNAVAQSATDYWAVNLTNVGLDGLGADIIGAHSTLDVGGSAMVAYVPWSLGELSAEHKEVAAGEVLVLAIVATGTPTALAETSIVIEYALTAQADATPTEVADVPEIGVAYDVTSLGLDAAGVSSVVAKPAL